MVKPLLAQGSLARGSWGRDEHHKLVSLGGGGGGREGEGGGYRLSDGDLILHRRTAPKCEQANTSPVVCSQLQAG